MDEKIKQQLMDKNKRLIDMVVERAKKDFPDDIAIIGLTGSFSTGDFHEKSDLDLIIINNTPRGWEISRSFILGDVGYDIYCTPWDTRIEEQSRLQSPMISHLLELQILYCAKPEYLEKLNGYRQKALDELAKPIGKDCIERAQKSIDIAKQKYAQAMLCDSLGEVRKAAGVVLYNLVNAVVSLNNTYIKRGVKRYLEELQSYHYLPEDFIMLYMSVIDAKTVESIRTAALQLLKSVLMLSENMRDTLIEKPLPTYENLRGTYEELWCNCLNKVIVSVASNDKSYAFHAALGAQSYLDEMTADIGTKKFDLMQYFNADNLTLFREAFIRAMEDYLAEYVKAGRKVEHYETVEQLHEAFMQS